ncbi:MAG: proline--tRNA ligase [Gammaproteobacteria bacterium]|nr:proline--tRNA ligase [Gammaproteobacteria bacterium]
MLLSQTLVPTLRETPSDADVASHVLLLRAGCIRQLASGLYSWLPIGLCVLRKIEVIVREELARAGAQEILMPVVQPAELWLESGRWDVMGPEMMRMRDRNDRDYALAPTHEEVVSDLIRKAIVSYKQLPCNLYQINTKFRDEIRPRFGLLRAREFVMKDGYSFHLDDASFELTYQAMFDAYSRILNRIGLDFRAVDADPGTMGDGESHEFHVLAESGEDAIAFSPASSYAANVEKAEAVATGDLDKPALTLEKKPTPDVRTIDDVAQLFQVAAKQTIKTLVVKGTSSLVGLVLRGDHQLNEKKASRLPEVAQPFEFASEDEIRAALACGPGSIGPVNLHVPFYVDRSAAIVSDFICGANEDGFHFTGANWKRDATATRVVDIRNVVEGEPAADASGPLKFIRGIEVGHIFKLGTKYTAPMNVTIQDAKGVSRELIMGCYGLGISRLVAAAVEQCHDDEGIIWPEAIAPAMLHIVAINYSRSDAVRAAAHDLYDRCLDAHIDVFLDDRDERPGVKFADADLLGLPHRVIVGERNLAEGRLEYSYRRSELELVTPTQVLERLQS